MKKRVLIFLIIIVLIFINKTVDAANPNWYNLNQNTSLVYQGDIVNFSVTVSDPIGIKKICFHIQENIQPYTVICDDSMQGQTETSYSITRQFSEEVDTRFQWYIKITNLDPEEEKTNQTPPIMVAITTPPETLNDVPVSIRDDNILLVDGEPFFPIGTYSLNWNETDDCRIDAYGLIYGVPTPYSSNPFADLNNYNLNFFLEGDSSDFYTDRGDCGSDCWNCGPISSYPVLSNPYNQDQCHFLLDNSENYDVFPAGTSFFKSVTKFNNESTDQDVQKRFNNYYFKISSFLNCLSQHNTPFIYYSYDEINAHASWIDPLLEPYGTNTLEKLDSTYTLLKKADPFHPIWVNLGPSIGPNMGSCEPNNVECNLNLFIENSRKYTESSDIVSIDFYPADNLTDEGYMNQEDAIYKDFIKRLGGPPDISATGFLVDIMVNEVTKGEKPFWFVPDHSLGSCGLPDSDPRGPTLKEKRFMAYQAIIHGATGLVYFTWGDDAWCGYTYTISSQDEKYFIDDTSLVANEIQTLSPILISGITNEDVQVDDDKIEILAKELNNELYILSVNAENLTKTPTFNIPSEYNQIQEFFDKRPISLSDGSFSDGFENFGVHTYLATKSSEEEITSNSAELSNQKKSKSMPFNIGYVNLIVTTLIIFGYYYKNRNNQLIYK